MSLKIILLIIFVIVYVTGFVFSVWMNSQMPVTPGLLLKLTLVRTDRFGGLWYRSELAQSGEYTGAWFPIFALISAIICTGVTWSGLHYPEQTGGIGFVLAVITFLNALMFLAGRGPGSGG